MVLHSYRHRIGAAPGDPALEDLERTLSAGPQVTVPTILLEGGADGVAPPQGDDGTSGHFTRLRRQTTLEGVGHDLPQEAPEAFAAAILELSDG